MRKGLSRYARSEDGLASVEAMFWFLLATGLLILAMGATLTFQGYVHVTRSIQDGNRHLSIGRFRTVEEVETYIEAQIVPNYAGADATVALVGNMVDTTVTIPWSAIDPSGVLGTVTTPAVTFTAMHRVEWMP
jgi:hypothetical protein